MARRGLAVGEIRHGGDEAAKDEILQGDARAGGNGGDGGDALEGVFEGAGIGKDSLTD